MSANVQINERPHKLNDPAQKVIYPELSYQIIGILFTVHNELGRFCNEKQYGDSIEKHLKTSAVKYDREQILPPSFAGEAIGRNRVDFLIDDKIVLEIKTEQILTKEDYYQVQRYLTALKKKLGILVNFRQKFIAPKRILNAFNA
ncbi:MAG: hypothetical protein Greene071421_369 [Parcubacteria group bacterium Greene0714_21]|nr:MAG: hypothetical protein Greene041639_23 [Parcubacteria group bacterium Greene0416_39]TSC98353.1 MAG: hypothetical protein Greene101447_96 [Parcubacteria group bacterium Greene1014_47]TSD04003.1 MAG: hypothetical protein Greene071421_369 [Parcubacteria group bacterium Greene0714_21]